MRRLFVAAVVLQVLLTVSPLSALPVKSEEQILPASTGTIHSSCETVHVKFQESARVRFRDRGLVSLAGDDVHPLLSLLDARSGSHVARIFTRPETQLNVERVEIQRQSGQAVPDLNSWYVITLPYPDDQCRIVDQLLALPIVEQAYPYYGVELATVEEHNTWAAGSQSNALVPPDLTHLQGYLNSAPAGIDAYYAWTVPGGKGLGVSLVDVEYDWNLEHEDLVSMHGREPFFGTRTGVLDDRDHGTAMLGEIAGTENGYGITGIAPKSIVSVAAATDISSIVKIADAIDQASSKLHSGDVILVPLQASHEWNPLCKLLPVEWLGAVYDAIKTAVAKGIIVVEVAGNGGHNLDSTIIQACFWHGNPPSSGAIMVGAGSNYDRSRLSSSNYGSRVDLQGWGQNVFTAGYGNSGYSGSSENEWYKTDFGKTCGASAIVAGAVLDLQGVSILNGGRLSPSKIRNILVATGSPQTGSEHIGPLPNLRAAIDLVVPPPPPPSNDNATFLSHVTLPDGTVVTPGQALHKVWRVRNSGSSTWTSGYQLVFIGGHQMGAPSAVDVPETVTPGATVDLSVDMTAPSTPDQYVGHWRMRNAQGVYFGDELKVEVRVSPVSSRISLYTDPPSPSSASTVRIHSRVDGLPNFRAMRLLIDGEVVHETAAIELFHNWETGGYSVGNHALTVEAADWSDLSWSHPERRSTNYDLRGSGPANHAPYPPTQIRPADWHVSWDGQPPELCASHNGDPDGDPVTEYYFDVTGPNTWNSGWTGADCVTPSGLGYHTYGWKVRVRDDSGAESEWSDELRFTLVDQVVTIPVMYFDPASPAAADEVHLFAESEGCGGMVTMRASANTANDGTDSGEWVFFYELGLPHIEPIWPTLPFSDGTHQVRVEARGCGADWQHSAAHIESFTLLHRRPAEPQLIAPTDGQYVNRRTVAFRWEEPIRAESYRLQVSTNPDPSQDPLVDVTLPGGTNVYTHTFDADYQTLYWRVGGSNDVGTTFSPRAWRFGIDRTRPETSVAALPPVSFDTQLSVSWGGTDAPAGIQHYDVKYRDGGRGAWVDWMRGITSTVALFQGQPGHTYYFRSRALDNAQNQETYSSGPDTYTLIDPTQQPPTPWWNPDYSAKRDIVVLNNDDFTMWTGHPVELHFDDTTSPTASELYAASLSPTPGDDFRIVYTNTVEIDRYIQRFTASAIDIWFNTQVEIAGLSADTTNYQLYYGNVAATSPPIDINDVFEPGTDANTVGLWHLQEGDGNTVYDSSGRGHNGTLHNGIWMMSGLGRAVDFDGEHTYIEVPSHSDFNLQHFTLEAWIWYPEYVGANKIIARPINPPNEAPLYAIETSSHRIRMAVEGTGGLESQSSIPLGRWVHVAGTYDGSRLRIYINGRLDRETSASATLPSSNRVLGIGFDPNRGQHFYGRMQHVRISNVARSSFPYAQDRPLSLAPSTAVGVETQQPSGDAADLVVQSLDAYRAASGGVIVQTVVRNEGDASTTNGFYTDLYAGHLPTGPGDITGSVRFWVACPIEARTTITLSTIFTDLSGVGGLSTASLGPLDEITATLYTQADSEGVVTEPDEVDNISSGVDVCIASADVYEEDDIPANAQPIALGETQRHNHHSLNDEDWVKFTASAGVTYTVGTSDLGFFADTYLHLYDTDGTTLLAANDDYSGSLASQLDWAAPVAGTYYVMVRHWNPNVAGCGTSYSLFLGKKKGFAIWLPLVLRNR